MENTGIDVIYWTNMLGCGSLIAYASFILAQMRGLMMPSPLVAYIVRFCCMVAFVSPIAARLYLSQQTILFLALMLVVIGLMMKMRRILGI